MSENSHSGKVRASLLVVTIVTSLIVVLVSRCGNLPVADPVASTRPDGGGALRMIQEEPVGLDPILSESVYESLPVNQLFDTLVASDDSLNVVPSLAESWKISRDGLQYDIRLRGDVRFHDGKVLTAEDVVFTFHRVLRIGGTDSLAYPYLTVIKGADEYVSGAATEMIGVTQRDERTVRFQLKHRNPLFLELLTLDNLSIVPKHLLSGGNADQDEAFARAPIGTGPFVFGEWTDDHIRLDRNSSYFGGPAHLDEVRLNFYGEEAGDYGEARYLAGELDLLEPTSRSLARMQKLAGTNVQQFQELSISFLGLNSSRPPLDQRWLRQAIAHAIDRDRMVDASPTLRRSAPGILPPGIAGFTPEEKRLVYDPERSKQLLAEAGHTDGRGLPPIRLYDPSGGSKPDAVIEQIISDLAAVGIRFERRAISWAEMGERLDNGSCDAFVLAWVADMSDPDAFLSIFGESGASNYFQFEDDVTRALLRDAGLEFEPAERGRAFREVERYVLEQAPIVPLYHTRGALASRAAVRGLQLSPYGIGRIELEHAWIQRPQIAGVLSP